MKMEQKNNFDKKKLYEDRLTIFSFISINHFFKDTFNTECIVIVTSDDIVRQEMAYNRERKHTMKKRAKKLRLRIVQR